MIRYIKVIFVCCTLLRSIHTIRLPSSPCPNVFAYEGDADSDRWHGVITFSSNIELVGMNYKVQLDRPSQLLVSWDGDVRTEDNMNYNVFDPYHTQQAGEIVKARIMVKFNPNKGIPGIMRIVINGNTMCSKKNSGSGFGSGQSGDSTSDRYDPSFGSEGDDREPPSEVSNNRGPSPNNNYGGSGGGGGGGGGGGAHSPNYNENTAGYETQPNAINNRPPYVANEPAYIGGGSSNSNSNRQAPHYNGATNPPSVYVVNPSNTAANTNSGPYNGNTGNGYSGSSNFNNNPSEYPNENRPQWSVTQSPSTGYNNNNNNNNNRTGSWQNGFSNGQSVGVVDANGPIVTTLTLPNGGAQNKTNIDQIVQIIKNQLEQQQISSSSNKTVIVAVVNPMVEGNVSQNNANGTITTTDSSVIYRTTTQPLATTITTKAKIVVSTAKSSSSNGHTSRPKD